MNVARDGRADFTRGDHQLSARYVSKYQGQIVGLSGPILHRIGPGYDYLPRPDRVEGHSAVLLTNRSSPSGER